MINDKNPASLKKHMRGAETVEYVILAALVATTLAIAMPRLASSVGDKMTDVSTDLDRTGGGGGSIGGGGTGGDGDDGTGGDGDGGTGGDGDDGTGGDGDGGTGGNNKGPGSN